MTISLHILVALTVLHICVSVSKCEVTDTPKRFICGTKNSVPPRKNVNPLIKSYVTNEGKLWPGGIVPYVLDTRFSSEQIAMIRERIQTLHRVTDGCIKWVPRTNEEDFVSIVLPPGDKKCDSYVGKAGGEQILNLGKNCFYDPVAIIHEMMHALGFIHEHQRPDRDCYIRVYTEKMDHKLWNSIYSIKQESSVDFPYDLNSIMHYDDKNSKGTIIPHNGKPFGADKDGKLSVLDIWKLRHLYCGAPSYCEVYSYECWCRWKALQKCAQTVN